jgi:integrase
MVRTTPFRFEGQSMIDVPTSGSRHRRFQGDEETRLLDAADAFTKNRIVATLELGCPGGELLNLTWADSLDHHVVLTTRKTRTGQPKQRKVTISPRFASSSTGARLDPTATTYRQRLTCLATTPARRSLAGWLTLCGMPRVRRPASRKTNTNVSPCASTICGTSLGPTAGSRAPLHDVQMMLGHENITTTSTYLNATPERQKESLDKLAAHRLRKRLRVV